jgi:hypothetical protein
MTYPNVVSVLGFSTFDFPFRFLWRLWIRFKVMVFTNIINNISTITWWSVLLVEKTEVPGENHRHATNHWQPLSHNVVSSIPPYERDSNSHILWWYHSYDNSYMLKIKLCLPTTYCCSRHFVANKKENVSCRN